MNYIATSLTRTLIIDSIVSLHYFEYTPQFRYSGEAHDFWELIYCDKGYLRLTAGNEEYILSRGQAFLHPPSQFHNICAHKEASANSIIVSFCSDCPSLFSLSDKVISTDSFIASALFSILREAQASFKNPLGMIYDAQLLRKDRADYFASEQVIQNYMELLLIRLIRQNDPAAQAPEFPLSTRSSQLLNEIIRYMKEHLSEKLTFGQIAEHFSISPTTLKKLFRRNCGCGTMEYLTKLRIELAKALLLEGKLSCTDIAAQCGFCSIHHFSKVFKDASQMAPTEYVRSVKAMLEEPDIRRK